MRTFLNIISVFSIVVGVFVLFLGIVNPNDFIFVFYPSCALFVVGIATALVLTLTTKPGKK